jgi:hypothetical protein
MTQGGAVVTSRLMRPSKASMSKMIPTVLCPSWDPWEKEKKNEDTS